MMVDSSRMTFVHGVLEGFPWVLSVPRRAEDLLTSDILTLASTLLTNSLLALEIRDPTITYPMRVFGIEGPVNAFLTAWVTAHRSRGQRLRLTSNPPTTIIAYATRDTFSAAPQAPQPPPLNQHRIYRASTISDIESLIPFYAALFDANSLPTPTTGAITKLQATVNTGLIWICRTSGVLSAFVELGRVTPRTVSIRTVYVPPEHRQRGVAETIVRAVSRYYLGLGAADLSSVRPGPPPEGVKDQIKLSMADISSEAAYRRLGFLLPDRSQGGSVLEGGVDPATGHPGWYRAIWREVEPGPDLSVQVPRGDGKCFHVLFWSLNCADDFCRGLRPGTHATAASDPRPVYLFHLVTMQLLGMPGLSQMSSLPPLRISQCDPAVRWAMAVRLRSEIHIRVLAIGYVSGTVATTELKLFASIRTGNYLNTVPALLDNVNDEQIGRASFRFPRCKLRE